MKANKEFKMEKFEDLMNKFVGENWREEYPESLYGTDPYEMEAMLREVCKQGNCCLTALLSYLRAIHLVRAYPLDNQR